MKIMKIEGMMCKHCVKAVTKALNSIDGVEAEVNLEKGEAVINCPAGVGDEELTAAVVNAGYEVKGIQ